MVGSGRFGALRFRYALIPLQVPEFAGPVLLLLELAYQRPGARMPGGDDFGEIAHALAAAIAR